MKKIIAIILTLVSASSFAGTNVSASLVHNNTYLSIHLEDDQLIPPFEAGELWKVLIENQQIKRINEKEFNLTCEGLTVSQTNDTFGNCQLLVPYNLFKKIKNKMVFKAEGEVAMKLNRYFIDSAYWSTQGQEVYLSSFNTRRQFFFGIDEDLIRK